MKSIVFYPEGCPVERIKKLYAKGTRFVAYDEGGHLARPVLIRKGQGCIYLKLSDFDMYRELVIKHN